jgi:hypothetical protein
VPHLLAKLAQFPPSRTGLKPTQFDPQKMVAFWHSEVGILSLFHSLFSAKKSDPDFNPFIFRSSNRF